MRLQFDPESGALYIRVREGEVEETLERTERDFGSNRYVDRQDNVLGLEFLSFVEYAKLATHFGGTLDFPSG
jgi:uncharacterized protein YuzE